MSGWLALVRPGDWLTVALGALAVALAFPLLWRGGPAERAVIRLDGRVVAEYPLDAARRFEVAGPLGKTVIEIQPGRARVPCPGRHSVVAFVKQVPPGCLSQQRCRRAARDHPPAAENEQFVGAEGFATVTGGRHHAAARLLPPCFQPALGALSRDAP